MASVTAEDILRRVRRHVEQGWCQDSWALDADANRVYPDDPVAVAWCLLGAWAAVESQIGGSRADVSQYIYAALPPHAKNSMTVYNDEPGRTQAEIVALLDRAIFAASRSAPSS